MSINLDLGRKFPKVVIGILSFNDRKYLEQNLPALLNQTYANFEIVICNNYPDPEPIDQWLKSEFPEVALTSAGGNVGFGQGHNHIIRNFALEAKYYLCFNSDMVATSDFLEKLVSVAEQDTEIGVVTGKLRSWINFPEGPEHIIDGEQRIDTTGLVARKNFHVVDRGQGQLDVGQFDQAAEVFGVSGASPLMRIKMLKDIQHSDGEYFDRHFFMYKEDVDLAMRVKWAGWKTVYTPTAVAYHDRTAKDPGGIVSRVQNKRNVPEYIKRNSFLNQLLLTTKNWSADFSIFTKLRISSFIMKYVLYLLFLDPKILTELRNYFKLRKIFYKRGKEMPRRISAAEFEQSLT